MAELKPEKKDYLRYVKGYYYIERHIIHQYVKKDDANDEHTEVYSNTEGVPARLIEGSSVTSSVVAQIANEKYNLATPLYRMEQDCMRNGIPISRQNMSNWLIRCGEDYLGTVFDRMHSDLITDAKIIHMDETTKVVIEDRADGREKSYIWMAMTGKYEPSQMILYFYYESREHRHVEDILGHDYTGYLNSDGFGGYHSYPGAVCCGCWAHYRRKAYEAMISDDNIYSAYNKLHSADERRTFLDGHPSFKIKVALLEKIDQIMELEPKEEKTSAEEIYQIRQEKALPLIEALFTWTRELEASIPPKSKLGEAVKYGSNEEQYLRNHLLDGHLEITNNLAEREGIKPYVILRKNELFSSTRRGASTVQSI